MLEQIANLHERMSQGGNWLEWRDEIVDLHAQAKDQQEFVVLLEAFNNLVAVGPSAYDHVTWERLLPVAIGEYKTFLNFEACDGGTQMNPVLLKHIVEREIEAGRLHPDDDYAKIAVAGGNVLGDTSDLIHRPARPGNWLAGGLAIGGILLWIAGVRDPVSPLWLIPSGFLLGWLPNHLARKKVMDDARQRRLDRGYPV